MTRAIPIPRYRWVPATLLIVVPGLALLTERVLSAMGWI